MPANSPWLNRIETQFTPPRYFTVYGTDHATHREHASRSAGTSSGATTGLRRTAAPAEVELRDGQIYRWHSAPPAR
jgi:hypothetical protein